MRVFAPINALLHLLIFIAASFVLPIISIAHERFFVLSVLSASGCILSLGLGFLQVKGLLTYWVGFAAGTFLGCIEVACACAGIYAFSTDWISGGAYVKAYLILVSIVPFFVLAAFTMSLAGGVVMEVDTAVDWLCDLVRTKQDLRGKHVLVTGGGTGLGQALAIEFASLGANVTILSRNMKHLEETRDIISEVVAGRREYGKNICSLLVQKPPKGGNYAEVHCCVCDVTNLQLLEERLKEAVTKFGNFDIVATCAGFAKPKYFIDSSTEDFEQQIKLNYMGTVNTVKATLPYMLEKGAGSYIIVSSALALMGSIGYASYCGSKYAVRGFADALRMEFKPHNISVHQFYPANMDTPSYKEENKTKPVEAKQIDESASTVTAEVAGEACMNGFLRGYPSIDNAPIEIGTVRIMGNGITPRPNPFRDFLYLPVGFIAGHIVGECFDETVADARKKAGKRPGVF